MTEILKKKLKITINILLGFKNLVVYLFISTVVSVEREGEKLVT